MFIILLTLSWICIAASFADDGREETKVIRTIVYHEITALDDDISCHNGARPVISDNGERVAFAMFAKDDLVRIYAMLTDGSQPPQEIDSFKESGDTIVAISPDGTKVAWGTFHNEIGLIDIASGRKSRFALDGGLFDFRIKDDGRIYFLVSGDTTVRGSSPAIPVQRGLWTVNFDGSGLTQIAGPEEIASLLGVSADSVGLQGGYYWAFDVSWSGSRAVFPVYSSKGRHILGANTDGTTEKLIEYPLGEDHISNVIALGISGDGSKVYYIVSPNPCCSTPKEMGIFNFDGSNGRLLMNGTDIPDYATLSYDGSLMLAGITIGLLVSTESEEKLQLTVLGGWESSEPALVGDGLYLPSMDGSGTRFIYLTRDARGLWQLVVAEMNPGQLGQAPTIGDPRIVPPFILTMRDSRANVSASITTGNALVGVGTDFLQNGLKDRSDAGQVWLEDDGSGADLSAGDGIYSGTIEGREQITAGPRTVRLKAEAKGSDGKRHATAVDLWPFAVAQNEEEAEDTLNTPPPTWPPTVRPPTVQPPDSTTSTNEPPVQPPRPPLPPGDDEQDAINLTGIWNCNDGGVYYIRQIGDAVWWDGQENSTDPYFANVAHGTISGNTVSLQYADVPEGASIGSGLLTLEVISNDELTARDKPISYAGSHWTRSIKTSTTTLEDPRPPISPQNPWEDPSVRSLIDEWLLQQDNCIKEVYGSSAYVDEWGRACGELGNTQNICIIPPEHFDWDYYHYHWYNNYCPSFYPYTVRQYVQMRQSATFESLSMCKERGEVCYSDR